MCAYTALHDWFHVLLRSHQVASTLSYLHLYLYVWHYIFSCSLLGIYKERGNGMRSSKVTPTVRHFLLTGWEHMSMKLGWFFLGVSVRGLQPNDIRTCGGPGLNRCDRPKPIDSQRHVFPVDLATSSFPASILGSRVAESFPLDAQFWGLWTICAFEQTLG